MQNTLEINPTESYASAISEASLKKSERIMARDGMGVKLHQIHLNTNSAKINPHSK